MIFIHIDRKFPSSECINLLASISLVGGKLAAFTTFLYILCDVGK